MNLRYLGLARAAAFAALAPVLLAACGGGGDGGNDAPAPTGVTISGRITFDRIPFDATAGNGLNPAAIVESPARQVTVQALDASTNAELARTTTDDNGNYSVTVPPDRNLFIRARAEMIKTGTAPTWNFRVANNANSDALYVLDGTAASSGNTNSTRNLRAPTGFVGNSYTGVRAAAPFAILDTVFRVKQLILSATPSTAFPDLQLFWSDQNRPAALRFCPDDGDIGTTSYIVFPVGDVDDCNRGNPDGIYILGDFTAGDTDEFDESVIAHELGHYVEDRFGRSDSLGGEHGLDVALDLRVAFSEGWGNAFSAMVLGGPIYRDSFEGMNSDFQIDVESDDQVLEGWFSESSVQEIFWDLFDATNEPGDGVALGFPPLYSVVTGAQITTDALTSIYTFISGLNAANAGSVAAIDTLLDGEDISGMDDFGAGESNDGGDPGILPIYKMIMLGTPITVCSRSPAGNVDTNKLGNRVFVRFDNDAPRAVTITVTGQAVSGVGTFATDPDVFVLRRGTLVAFGVSTPPPPHTTPGSETLTQVPLAAGTHIIEVYDFDLSGSTPRCMNVSIQGN